MKKFIVAFLLLCSALYAETDEYKVDLYFANGIMMQDDEEEVRELWQERVDKLLQKYSHLYGYIGTADAAYNISEGMAADMWEAFLQKVDLEPTWGVGWSAFKETISRLPYGKVAEFIVKANELASAKVHDETLHEQITKYEDSIKAGHGVVVVAHSQGNLFTHQAYNSLDGWMQTYFHTIAVATPDSSIINSGHGVTFYNDMITLIGMNNNISNPNKHDYIDVTRNALGEIINQELLTDQLSIQYHGFEYYLGYPVYEEALREGSTTITNRELRQTDNAKTLILGWIYDEILDHININRRPSQWKPKNIGCLCKDRYAKMIHKFDPEGMNQYLSNEKVKDFAEDGEGKIYKANTGDHAEYVRALDGNQSDDGVFTIEEVDRDNICYTLKDDASNEIGRIEGRTEPIPVPKSGVVQVTLTWDNPAIDFDLNVGWNAGENDIQDTGCPMEHFYVTSQYDIYPGTYPITVTHKQLDENESALIPEKMQMIIQVPGKTEVYDIDINTVEELEVGHVADIFVRYINNEIVPDISPDPVLTPVISIPSGGGSSGGGYVGGSGSSGGSSGGTPWVPIDNPSCDQSCGCIPCEYKIIPYLEQLLYGPISGADIVLYEARDYQNKSPLYVGKTSGGDTLYTAGNIEIPDSIVNGLQDDTLYLLVARGGHDIDHDDDFEIDDIPTLNQGDTHLLLSGKDIKEIGFKMNALTEIAYQITKNIIDVNTTQEVQNKLNEVAQRLLKDKVYGDTTGGINYKDLSFWMPTIHKPLLIKEYSEHFSPLVDNLFANRDVYQEAYAIVYDHVSAVPTLQSIRLDINEDINSSIIIGKVPVLNKGASEITSFTLEGDGSENFDIDANGEVSISENAHLDYESKTYYQLYVSAVNDDGVSQKILLLIQLHNVADAPEYQSFTAFTFYENSAVGTEAMRVLYDSGNSPLQSVQLTGKDSAYFRADIEGNTISVKVNQTLLSYITKRAYELQLQVSNLTETSQSLPVTLIVSDRRDIPKLGYEWNLRVDENTTAGTVVGKVKVISDGYSPIQYFKVVARNDQQNLLQEWPDGYFEIDENGIVRVGENASFDYEKRSSYSAYITAINTIGESQKGFIRVNLNNIPDTPPSFWDIAPLKLRVNKEAQPGTVLGNLNFSHGDNQVTMIKLNPLSPFEAVLYNSDSANIKTKDSLRDMQVYEYNLTAVVSNSAGDSNEKPIHITVNRESYEFSALEGTYNTVIGKIGFGTEAVQSVTLPSSNEDPIRSYFTLDNNGVLSTKAYEKWTEVLNYSKRKQMSFTAKVAYQNGETKDIGITVNVLSRIISNLDTPGAAKKIILNKEENRAYIADHNYGLHIVDITDIYNPKMISSLDTDGVANDLVLSADQQYIYLLDVGKGLKIVDISDEANPYVAAKVPLASYSYNIALSSDGNRAFVSHGSYGVEVIDLTDPVSPQIITTIGFMGTYEENYGHLMDSSAYDVSVSKNGDILFIADWVYGLQGIDIADLSAPVSIYSGSYYNYTWDKVLVDEEKKIVILHSFENGTFYKVFDISDLSDIDAFKTISDSDTVPDESIKALNNKLAFGGWDSLIAYDFTNPVSPIRIASIGSLRSNNILIRGSAAFVASGTSGLTIINLEGIDQPKHTEPTLLESFINIKESNISTVQAGDNIGRIKIWESGDSPIAYSFLDEYRDSYGSPVCDNETWKCDAYDEFSYFDIDLNGSISINNIEALNYDTMGNRAVFAAYAENENGHQSNQAKITVAIKEDADWTLKFQKSIIKIDANLSIGASIGNVMLKKSQREIFWIKIYDHDEDYCYGPGMIGANGWGIDLIDDPYNRYGNLNHYCHENSYFEITKEGEIHIKETPLPGHYVLHIVAEDRFGLRWLEKQEIEVLAP